jgi:predicted phosphodiesterase
MDKIAVFSDIHGNALALEAVLRDADQRGACTLINLGDLFYGPLWPKKTYDLLRPRDMLTVSGNQDRQLREAAEKKGPVNATLAFVLEDLGTEPVDWIRDLPAQSLLEEEIFLCHGAPENDLIYLLEDVSSGLPRLREDRDILELILPLAAPVILCGHSHLARVVTLSSGQLVINPGSVGLPAYRDELPVAHCMQTFTPHASYALLEKSAAGWQVDLVKVPYPHAAAARIARQRGREDWAACLTGGRAGEGPEAKGRFPV